MKRAILLVDHGSRVASANAVLEAIADMVRAGSAERVIVEVAHQEIAAPSVAEGFARCVAAGAEEVIVFPYFLGPGRHAAVDVPRLSAEAALNHPGVRYRVTEPLGAHELLAQLVLLRTGVGAAS